MPRRWTLVTGAGGFVGQYVLGALLRRGVRCVALLRDGDAVRLHGLLAALDPAFAPDPERLRVAAGALPDALPRLDIDVERVVHVAGSTAFRVTGDEPQRTNVAGMRGLLAWMEDHGVRDLAHVSTAYVCGAAAGPVAERVEAAPPPFRNAYEESKWQAEQVADAWRRAPGRRLVIARPSIVTGATDTGRATAFRGFYVIARAVEQLARSIRPDDDRHRICLRLRGCPETRYPIVPVDHVADAIAALALDAAAHGVYHLHHPHAPSNGDIKRWLESIFDLGGGEFVGDARIPLARQSLAERAFYGGMQPLVEYFAASPELECGRAEAALRRAGLSRPRVDRAYVERCVAYARGCGWGRAAARETPEAARFGAAYFERFLPAHLPRSQVGRMTPIRATIRFVIDGLEWVCRFDAGRLAAVGRGPNGLSEQFGYRTSEAGFWRAISGRVDGEQLFMTGEADVFGDVESALKMSAILREFTREFPCDRSRLEPYAETT